MESLFFKWYRDHVHVIQIRVPGTEHLFSHPVIMSQRIPFNRGEGNFDHPGDSLLSLIEEKKCKRNGTCFLDY
jgi:hypothetical protein